ncbi:hypothetical protein [Gemmobacter sp. 24YEA27]|uniref:hypothetical protein n=1 Tax=Gemmobacter sp. 24YEA27 TaxID=3040672 RepID=UPI0024B395B5|nr:hypothetical protein [Gemmobacter sp. 24YEA27]
MALALALAPAVAAMAVPAQDFPVTPGSTLTGEVITEVFPATGGQRILRETGRGEATILETAPGEITFTAKSETADRGGISFSFRLRQGNDGIWREMLADSHIAVTPGGRITGLNDSGSDLIILSGLASQEWVQLEIRHQPHPFGPEGEPPDLAELVDLRFHFDLRAPSKAAAAPLPEKDSNACRQIQWQTRASPNIFGGGVDLIRVPVCIP